jgi:cytidylate kinase
MKLVFIFGPPAVGKMTVGQQLAQITDLKLFHNHMSLELVNHFFDFGTPELSRLDKVIRFSIFKEVAASQLEGLIFTLMRDFDFKEDDEYVQEIISIFEEYDAQICFVELEASFAERLKRNTDAHRLAHKPSKRDLEMSEKSFRYFEKEYRMNSTEDEIKDNRYLKINNTNISPQQVAQQIKTYFNL